MPENNLPKFPKCRHRCRLVQRDDGFVVFLFLIPMNEDQNDDKENAQEDVQIVKEDLVAIAPECDDIEEDLDAKGEREIPKELNLTIIRVESTILDIPTISQCEGSMPLILLSTFPINEGEYILCLDIQRSIGLREDESLA